MHAEALDLMNEMLDAYLPKVSGGMDLSHARILDVGSLDINGTLRPLIEARGWRYTGCDTHDGANVDWLSSEDHLPFESDTFNFVLCANMLHNAAHPWLLIPEMARVLRPRGLLAIVTLHSHGGNPYPKDYWRFQPDGLAELFNQTALLYDYHIRPANDSDIIASAVKR